VGFVHGVMNTDNMSVLGLTIDYGPYGWLEDYDPGWTPNTTDAQHHRYRFGAQPQVALWNLAQLGNALMPLVEDAVPLEEALSEYSKSFDAQWQQMMGEKLGFTTVRAPSHAELISELQDVLQQVETDMPIFFRRLALLDSSPAASDEALLAPFAAAYYRRGRPAWADNSGLSSAGLMHRTCGSVLARLPVVLNIVQLVGACRA